MILFLKYPLVTPTIKRCALLCVLVASIITLALFLLASTRLGYSSAQSCSAQHKSRGQSSGDTTAEILLDAERGISLHFDEPDGDFPNTAMGNRKILPEFARFIFTPAMFGGIGNQMYKFASLYGIGQQLGRVPIYLDTESEMLKLEAEIEDVFPEFHKRIYYVDSRRLDEYRFVTTPFTQVDCCAYCDPHHLLNYSSTTFLQITGSINLQSAKYFLDYKEEIQRIFRCSSTVQSRLQEHSAKLKRRENSTLLCVHTRRGDLMTTHWASDAVDTIKAIQNIAIDIANNTTKSAVHDLLLMGEEKDFLHELADNSALVNFTTHITNELPRADEMCLAVGNCDALLISAHVSTYGFWLGFLMPAGSRVYLHANTLDTAHSAQRRENYPPEWISLIV